MKNKLSLYILIGILVISGCTNTKPPGTGDVEVPEDKTPQDVESGDQASALDIASCTDAVDLLCNTVESDPCDQTFCDGIGQLCASAECAACIVTASAGIAGALPTGGASLFFAGLAGVFVCSGCVGALDTIADQVAECECSQQECSGRGEVPVYTDAWIPFNPGVCECECDLQECIDSFQDESYLCHVSGATCNTYDGTCQPYYRQDSCDCTPGGGGPQGLNGTCECDADCCGALKCVATGTNYRQCLFEGAGNGDWCQESGANDPEVACDFNGDGQTTTSDMVHVMAQGKYCETSGPECPFAYQDEGDANWDEIFNSSDFVYCMQNGVVFE